MSNPTPKDPTKFVQAALAFDHDVAELQRLAREIQSCSLEKESGFQRGQKLMVHFTETGARVGEGVKILAQELDATRKLAEEAAETVAKRAEEFQSRQTQINQMLERFQALGEMAKTITAETAEAKRNSETEGGKEALRNYLPALDSQLEHLVLEARKLRDDAKIAEMKVLEQNAESLGQALNAARKRLSGASSNSPEARA